MRTAGALYQISAKANTPRKNSRKNRQFLSRITSKAMKHTFKSGNQKTKNAFTLENRCIYLRNGAFTFAHYAFFFCTRISSAAGAAGELKQHKKEPNMANRNTNPDIGKDDNEIRIQFGLILALCQNCAILHNPLFHAQKSNLFKGLSPMFPRCFHSL